MPDEISRNSDERPIMPDPDARPWYEPMTDGISRIANFSERQREQNPPDIIKIDKTAGLPVTNRYTTHQRLRIISLIISSETAADHYSIAFGGRTFDFYAAVGTQTIPFAYEVDRGIDIVTTDITSVDHNYAIYLVAYTE